MNEIEKASEVLTSEEKTIEFLEYLVRVTGFIEKDGPFRFFTKNFIAKRTGETLRATYNCAEKAFMIALKALYREQERDTEAKRRRAEENPKPLTLDELREMEGEPVYNADNKTWYVVEDIDEIDELSTVISMTDTTEFDSEEGLPKFYRTKPEGCGE